MTGKKIVQPSFLKKGNKVALVSPSYWLAGEAISQAAEVLKSWSLEPVVGKNVDCIDAEAYAGTGDERAADMRWALEDDDIKAVICTRGGYGCIHLLDRIPQSLFQQHPKWVIGHGDISVLLCAVAAAGVMSIYGPMSLQLAGKQELSNSLLHDILFGTLPQYSVASTPYNCPGHATGLLVGGNLSSFSPLAGTDYYLLPGQDIILFIEEIEESLHSIDRLFYMLRLQGVLNRVKGIVLGEFNAIKYDLQFNSVEQMLTHHLRNCGIPVCCGFPVGSNSCLPLLEGAPVTLDVNDEVSTLTFNVEGLQHAVHTHKLEVPLLK